jgi:Ion channel
MSEESVQSSAENASRSNMPEGVPNSSPVTVLRSNVHIPASDRHSSFHNSAKDLLKKVTPVSWISVSHEAKKKKDEEQKSATNTKMAKVLIVLVIVIFIIIFMIWFDQSPQDFAVANNDVVVLDKYGKILLDSDGKPVTKEKCPRAINGLYYSIVTLSSTGYGDICPVTTKAKMFTAAFQLISWSLSLGAIWYLKDGKIKGIAEAVKNMVKTGDAKAE